MPPPGYPGAVAKRLSKSQQQPTSTRPAVVTPTRLQNVVYRDAQGRFVSTPAKARRVDQGPPAEHVGVFAERTTPLAADPACASVGRPPFPAGDLAASAALSAS